MEKYILVRVMNTQNADKTKNYYKCYVLLLNDYGCDLIDIMITKEQFDYLKKFEFNKEFNIAQYIKIKCMRTQDGRKQYVPAIVLDNQK